MTQALVKILRWLWPLGVILLVAGFVLAIRQEQFSNESKALSIAGVVLFLTIFLRGESANVKFYVNVVANSALILGILVVAYLFLNLHQKNWDFTENKRYSLSDQTSKYLSSLKVPVRIVGFYSERTQPPVVVAREFLDRYAKRSDKVSVEIVDPYRDNIVRKQLKERFDTEISPGDLFIENASKIEEGQTPRFKKITQLEEGPVTNALIEVTQEKQVVVYNLQGHGEKTSQYAAAGQKVGSIADLKRHLTDRAMKWEDLTLRGPVPDDCSVLLVAGPTSDLHPTEAEWIKEYIDGGGRALIYFNDPDRPEAMLPNWRALMANYGVEVSDDLVFDYRGASLGNPMFILPESFDAYHEITKDFQGYLRTQAMFSGARAIAKAETMPSGFFATELIKTSPMTWTQTYRELLAVQRSGSLTMPGEDKLSARPLALAVSESGDAGARLVVFADADMISDEGLNSASLTLAVLAANWLAGQEELVAIPPKEIQSTPVFMKAEQLRMIFIMLVFALPCAVFFGGLSYTMIRRRTR